mmetsp:Transcript_25575/g.38189  ORF Transcript_25575/g.38189 Transcript_25575/m.38189 type:complete len:214 (-) Transcript_25575:1109-1750(-)
MMLMMSICPKKYQLLRLRLPMQWQMGGIVWMKCTVPSRSSLPIIAVFVPSWWNNWLQQEQEKEKEKPTMLWMVMELKYWIAAMLALKRCRSKSWPHSDRRIMVIIIIMVVVVLLRIVIVTMEVCRGIMQFVAVIWIMLFLLPINIQLVVLFLRIRMNHHPRLLLLPHRCHPSPVVSTRHRQRIVVINNDDDDEKRYTIVALRNRNVVHNAFNI